MIISASRRTDVPAFYADWFMARVRAGFCDVPNPLRPGMVTRIPLTPSGTEAIVFWTRNARPMLPHLAELDHRGYRYYFQYTLVDYPPPLEPAARPLAQRLDTFRELSGRIGPERVIWRYDPIVLGTLTPPEFHERAFARLADALGGHTRRCVVSLVDVYAKLRRHLKALEDEGFRLLNASEEQIMELLCRIRELAAGNGLDTFSCAETVDLTPCGILPGKCVDDTLIARLFGLAVSSRKDPSQRKACRCVASRDIGMYNTCPAGCLYCYATDSAGRAVMNFRNHRPAEPRLIDQTAEK